MRRGGGSIHLQVEHHLPLVAVSGPPAQGVQTLYIVMSASASLAAILEHYGSTNVVDPVLLPYGGFHV
jgi:hypothetical protein